MKLARAIIAGGGTGGHLFPGIAVAREMQRRNEKAEILFVGAEQGIESRLVPQEGFQLKRAAAARSEGRRMGNAGSKHDSNSERHF